MKKISLTLAVAVMMLFFGMSVPAFADSSSQSVSGAQAGAGAIAASNPSLTLNQSSHADSTRIFPDYPGVAQPPSPQYFGPYAIDQKGGGRSWNVIFETAVWNEKVDWWDGDISNNSAMISGRYQLARLSKMDEKLKTTKFKKVDLADPAIKGRYYVVAKITLYQAEKDENISFDNLWFKALSVNMEEIGAPFVAIEYVGFSNGYSSWGRNFSISGGGSVLEGGIASLVGSLIGGFSSGKGGAAPKNYPFMVVKLLAPLSNPLASAKTPTTILVNPIKK